MTMLFIHLSMITTITITAPFDLARLLCKSNSTLQRIPPKNCWEHFDKLIIILFIV